MNAIVPCIWFDDQAEQAAAFYTETFPKGRVVAVSRYPESADNPSKKPRGSVLTVDFEVAGQLFTALNGGPQFVPNASVSFFVNVTSAAEVDRLFAALAEGGKAMMPLGAYPWSERYAWVQDRWGVTWQLMTVKTSGGPTIVPSLMFSDSHKGQAEEAMKRYTSVFPNGRIENVERFAAGEGPEGTIKHGRFVVAGQALAVMDSPIDHGFEFNEAISLQIRCDDQPEIDRLWEALSDGGEKGPCGWVKDRFGVSWQVTPASMASWLVSDDTAARDRAFAAMLQMKKLDIAALDRAFAGR